MDDFELNTTRSGKVEDVTVDLVSFNDEAHCQITSNNDNHNHLFRREITFCVR